MKKLFNSSIFVIIAVLALATTGCARERAETPTPTPVPPTTVIPTSFDGTPTVLTVVATATQPPILGTPTPLQLSPTPTTGTAATGNAGSTEVPATPAPAPTVAPPPATGSGSEIVHIVQPGENLFRIGLQYGVDAETLAAYNGISDPTLIYVGQKIRIPVSGGGYTGSSGQIYIVQPGDTLYTIAVSFNVTVQALMNANGITNPDTIYIGQKLIVP